MNFKKILSSTHVQKEGALMKFPFVYTFKSKNATQ